MKILNKIDFVPVISTVFLAQVVSGAEFRTSPACTPLNLNKDHIKNW